MPRRAVFLDRDGTMLEIVHRPNFRKVLTAPFSMREYKLIPGLHSSLADIRDLGYMSIMITNQPDVAHGYVSGAEWSEIHQRFLREAPLDDWYMCRHRSKDNCPMKKPAPGMIIAAGDKYGINLAGSFMVGDSDADMAAGAAAGCVTILLAREYNRKVSADFIINDLSEAVKIIKAVAEQREEAARNSAQGLTG